MRGSSIAFENFVVQTLLDAKGDAITYGELFDLTFRRSDLPLVLQQLSEWNLVQYPENELDDETIIRINRSALH